MRKLTAIVPFWNGHETIGRLLDSLPKGLPVIIVDDHSDRAFDGEERGVEVIRPQEKGYFSGAVNAGMLACDTDVLILNQDVWFEGEGWVRKLESLRGRYAILGDGVLRHPVWPQGYVQGTFMYVARAVVERVGLFNERDYPLWGATCEYQLRACRQGFKALPTERFNRWMRHEPRPKGSKFGPAITEAVRREPERRQLFVRTPPAISVVVPCYNYGRYLGDCLGSLIGGETCLGRMEGQSFQSFEVIVVDDASTDETAEMGRLLADPWRGIRYIRHDKNLGTPHTLNTGVEAAKGKYVTIVSADDMVEPWHLETLYRVCEANPHRVAYGDLRQVKGGERGKKMRLPEYDFEQVLHKNPMSAGILYPKEAWRETGGYSKEMVHGREDWAFNIALGIHGWCGIHVGGKPGYLIRREKQNRSLTTATREWYHHFRSQLVGLFPEIYAGERPMGCCGRKGANPRLAKASAAGNRSKADARREVFVGAQGMSLIVFQRDLAVPKTFYGPITGAAYQFGGKRRIGRVDPRDLKTGDSHNPGFLEMFDHGTPLFRETADSGAPPPKKVVKPPEPEVEERVGTEVEALAVAHEMGVPDPGDMSVSAIRDLSGELSLEQWRALRDLELAGKGRKSALSFIEGAIENLGG